MVRKQRVKQPLPKGIAPLPEKANNKYNADNYTNGAERHLHCLVIV